MSGSKPKRVKIEAAATMKRMMADYFADLGEAAARDDGKVAWCTSVGPAELLRALGFRVHFPENHAAILGAQRTAMDYIPAANALGYSPDICSYLTSDIGAFLRGETPLTQAYGLPSVPRPDVLVYNTSQCRDVQEWFRYFGKAFDVPVLGINPPRTVTELTSEIVDDVSAQMRRLVGPLEAVAGARLDPGKLRETVSLSLQATVLWEEVLAMARTVPSPLTFFDATIHMGPIVVLRGAPEAVEYYGILREEIARRVETGVAAVEGERLRLYWEGMPIWGKLRALSELFASHRTCVAASTYCNSWIFSDFEPDRPWESMARAYTKIFIVRDESYKEAYIRRLAGEYSLDGVVFHEAKTCPSNSNTRYGMPARLREEGLPAVTIHGDLNDLRCYSEEQAVTSIEAFLEQLDEVAAR